MAKGNSSRRGTAGPSIDRDLFEPPYHQLAGVLRGLIASGTLRPGDRVPSETQLCQQYDVSPMTARRALMILLDEGLVTAARGRGTFVRPLVLSTATFSLQALEELFGDEDTSVLFLSVRTFPATRRLSERLAVPVGQKVIAMRRLLSRAGAPMAYHREYLVLDVKRPIVEAEMGITSLQGLFEGRGETVLKRGNLSIQTTVIRPEEEQLLQTPAGGAAFRIEHTFYDYEERPISWGWFIIPGCHLQFSATVGVQPVAASRSGQRREGEHG